MCTITYLPKSENEFIITHNRDEDIKRKRSSAPEVKFFSKRKVLMPVDNSSGGTWVAADKSGSVYCMMNGAFRKHEPSPPYKHSRGLIIPQAIEADSFRDYYRDAQYDGIEPFTLLHFGNGLIEKIVWDGKNKFYGQPDAGKHQLFTSATLYDEETATKRVSHFSEFLRKHPFAEPVDILQLHQDKYQDSSKSFLLDTGKGIQTVSITQVIQSKGKIRMVYIDLIEDQRSESGF